MVQTAPKFITVDKFITNYGDNERYELIDGELFEMEPTGFHELQFVIWLGMNINENYFKIKIF